MIHHQPTKYHHHAGNPLSHFLNLHTTHATAAAAAALALATDGLGHGHPHHSHQGPVGPTAPPPPPQHHQHHHQHPQQPPQLMTGFEPLRADPRAASVIDHRRRPSHRSAAEEDEEHDESSNEKSYLGEVSSIRREPFDALTEPSLGEVSDSDPNIDIDVDDRRDGREDEGKDDEERRPAAEGGVFERLSPMERRDHDGEEIAIEEGDYKDTVEEHDPTSPGAADTTAAVLDTDGYVGKSFTIAAILGLKKKQDDAAAAAVAAATEYGDRVMNLSTGAGYHQQHHQQRVAAAAAAAAAAIGRLPLVMAAAAAGMEKRDRPDSGDSADTCAGPLAGYGVGPLGGGQQQTAMQNLHQLTALHGGTGSGGSFSAFHPSSGGGGGAGHALHPGTHHHHGHGHHHQHFGNHHFHHHHQAQQQQQQQGQQSHTHHHQQHQQQTAGGHHMTLGPHHHHSHNHSREKFKELSKKSALSSSAASLKSKRVRTIFTPEQLERLEAEFERQQYMVGPERLYLAHTLQLTEAQVKVWFQNRRIKWRKHHLEITQQRLALIRQRQLASGAGVPMSAIAPAPAPVHLGQQQVQQGGLSGGRMVNQIESPELTICTDSMEARSGSEGED